MILNTFPVPNGTQEESFVSGDHSPVCTYKYGSSTSEDGVRREKAKFSLMCSSTGEYNVTEECKNVTDCIENDCGDNGDCSHLSNPVEMIPFITMRASVILDSKRCRAGMHRTVKILTIALYSHLVISWVRARGRDQVWPNPSLAMFGQDHVWPDQVWSRPCLAKCGKTFWKVNRKTF